MPLDIELFISEIEKRPALYNIKLKEYSDRNLKQKLWNELCEQFVENWNDLSASEKSNKGKELQARWKNLRTCFKREYDAQKKTPSGSAAKKKRKYVYFDQLLFFCNYIEGRETSSNLQSPVLPNCDTDSEDSELIQPETQGDNKPLRPSNIRKKKPTKCYEEALLEILREKKTDEMTIDEDKYFLLSLLPTFKTFDEDQNFFAKTEIMNVLRRVRLSRKGPTHMSTMASVVPLRPHFSSYAPGVPGSSYVNILTPSPTTQDLQPSSGSTEQESWDAESSDVSSIYSLQHL